MNRTITSPTSLLLLGILAAPAFAAGGDLSSLGAEAAGRRLCDQADTAKTEKDLDAIFERGQSLYQPRLKEFNETRSLAEQTQDKVDDQMRLIRRSVMEKRGADDRAIKELNAEIERWKQAIQEYEALEPWQRTNWVEDPHEMYHDTVMELEAVKRTRRTIDAMSDEAIRAFGSGIQRDRYQQLMGDLSSAKQHLEEIEPGFLPWKDAVVKVHDCIEARRAALKQEPEPLTAAAAKGTINGKCSGFFAMLGKKQRNTWPLKAAIELSRSPEGDVAINVVTKERGQKLTLVGKYGPNFTASGNLGTVKMSVKGTLSELPDHPDMLQGKGTGRTNDSSELQVTCNFAWKTNP